MFELSATLSIFRYNSPAVVPHLPRNIAERQHGFNGENHPWYHDFVMSWGSVVVGHNETGVKFTPDAVADEILDDSITKTLGIGLNDTANYVDFTAWLDRFNSPLQSFLSTLDQ